MLENDKPVGLLRYNLFWDNTPFCTMLFIDWNNQKKGTDLVFKPHVFLSFGKVQFQQTKVKKMPKLSARANQMLIGVPILKHETGTDLTNFSQIFTSLHYSKTNKNFQVFHDTAKKQDQVPDQSDCPNHF